MALALLVTIFDVDGVLVGSPHEHAWREALSGFAEPAGFTMVFYQAYVAGKPRLEGARAALVGLGGVGIAPRAAEYAGAKQVFLLTAEALGVAPALRRGRGCDGRHSGGAQRRDGGAWHRPARRRSAVAQGRSRPRRHQPGSHRPGRTRRRHIAPASRYGGCPDA